MHGHESTMLPLAPDFEKPDFFRFGMDLIREKSSFAHMPEQASHRMSDTKLMLRLRLQG